MTDSGCPARGFDHVEAWVFDLDNTLYPADCNLFAPRLRPAQGWRAAIQPT